VFAVFGIAARSGPCEAAIVTLNGYLFSTDIVDYPDTGESAILSDNPFFSGYPRLVDLHFGLYGYGSFRGRDDTLTYRQVFPVKGVPCAVVMEQGYIPVFDTADRGTSFTFVFFTAYYSLACDVEDNIHILELVIYEDAPSERTLSWTVDDLPRGTTTLLYPAEPFVGQDVFGGRVENVRAAIGDVTSEGLVILHDDLPYDYPGAYREYLVPGRGIYARSCNWDGAINGFSQDGKNPERGNEDKKAWEKWWDDHCFISACAR